MTLTSTRVQAGFEPIPGYVLREKLGSGGYGEVWLAEAPGGLKKAIKFVFGSIDEDRANNELKSLQRIRQVNHPFILSLERIEVIEGQLIIVTELAQGTLYDRYLEFKQKGFAGISRERLLGYMRDAADGLDFLCQQHDLQHLDVKPANLLLIADRVKVADFGLIKDIQSNSLSMMAGLTPTYAAPEMFDGRPGRFSDQYSLAIVYQELLTGTLPFRGRTTAQLANEHLQKAPNLESVPLLERPILSKALAKKPQMRFSDCREFINAIERVNQNTAQSESEANNTPQKLKPRPAQRPSFKLPERSPPSPSESPTVSIPADGIQKQNRFPFGNATGLTDSIPSVTSNPRNVVVLPGMDVSNTTTINADGKNAATSQSYQKTLTIGLGGMGGNAVLEMRRQFLKSQSNLDGLENRGFLIIDSDEADIQVAVDSYRRERLPYHCTLHTPLKSPQHYRQSSTLHLTQISRRWVYNIPRSLKTEGVRPLGMLAFLDRVEAIYDSIHETIVNVARSKGDELCFEPIEVQIASSAHGGTGSSIACEIGFLIQQIAAEFEIPIRTELVLTCAAPYGASANDLPTASALACLTEINHYYKTEGLHPSIANLPASKAVHQPPFHHVTLLYGGQFGRTEDVANTISQAGKYLWSLTETNLGRALSSSRAKDDDAKPEALDQAFAPWISTIATREIEINSTKIPVVEVSRLCLRVALSWMAALETLVQPRSSETDPSTVDNKVIDQIGFFVGDIFRTNRWTAQAWVHRCMEALVGQDDATPNTHEKPIQSGSTSATNQGFPESTLDDEQKAELDAISESLAIEQQSAYELVSRLVIDTRSRLLSSISRKWLTSATAWANMREVTRAIAKQFSIHSNSLSVVAENLSKKHDVMLDALYQGSVKSSPELDQQLQATSLEARFHSVASKMLGRMAQQMTYVEDRWVRESRILLAEMKTWITHLCTQIGYRIEPSLSIPTVLESLMRYQCDETLEKEVRKSILRIVIDRCQGQKEGTFESVFEETLKTYNKPVQKKRNDSKDQNSALKVTEPVEMPKPITAVAQTQLNSAATHVPKISLDGTSTNSGSISSEQTNLAHEFYETRPYFVEFGGSVRNVLIVPKGVAEQLEPFQKDELDAICVTSIICNKQDGCEIICVGEHLILSDIIERVWMPSSDTWQLAARLYARVDVDWLTIE